jgi:hypothetical protein
MHNEDWMQSQSVNVFQMFVAQVLDPPRSGLGPFLCEYPNEHERYHWQALPLMRSKMTSSTRAMEPKSDTTKRQQTTLNTLTA